MKKVFATILAVIYLATTSGASITMHYCMGKIYSIDFANKGNCTKCGMKKAKGCCTDEIKVVKVQDTHQFISQQTDLTPSFAILQNNYGLFKPSLVASAPISATHNNSPAGSSGTSICIRNCVFRL